MLQNDEQVTLVKEYRLKIEKELLKICTEVVDLLNTFIIPYLPKIVGDNRLDMETQVNADN